MRKNLSRTEIGAAWVKQSQPEGRCSAMHFKGLKFCSYETVIGQIAKGPNGRRVYMVNRTGYSSTSSMHRGVMEDAIPKSAKVFHVPGIDRWGIGYFFDQKRIVGALKREIDGYLEAAKDAREPRRGRLLKTAAEKERYLQRYAAFWRLKMPR